MLAIAAAALLAGACVGFVDGLRRASPRARIIRCLIAAAVLLPLWQYVSLRIALHVVPDVLNVSSMLYSKELSEADGAKGRVRKGLRVFPLDAGVARQIEERGVAYFDAVPPYVWQSEFDRGEEFRRWRPTPIAADLNELGTTLDAGGTPLDVRSYLRHRHIASSFDPVIEIDVDMRKRVDAILQSPGSYFVQRDIGLMVVSPRARLVVYMYDVYEFDTE